jgi:hypothetical protein
MPNLLSLRLAYVSKANWKGKLPSGSQAIVRSVFQDFGTSSTRLEDVPTSLGSLNPKNWYRALRYMEALEVQKSFIFSFSCGKEFLRDVCAVAPDVTLINRGTWLKNS